MGKKKDGKDIPEITFGEEFIIRNARPYDYYDLCQLSEAVAGRDRDEIDWGHSYVGISQVDGQIAWGYIYSCNESPAEIQRVCKNELKPVELIDIFVRNNSVAVF